METKNKKKKQHTTKDSVGVNMIENESKKVMADIKKHEKVDKKNAESKSKEPIATVIEERPSLEKVNFSSKPISNKKSEQVSGQLPPFTDPFHWRAMNDLIVKLMPEITYEGTSISIGKPMQRKDKDAIVYEPEIKTEMLTSSVRFGSIVSVPAYLQDKYNLFDRISFRANAANVIDYRKDKDYAIVPAHAVHGIIEKAIVVDGEIKTAKQSTDGRTTTKMRNNSFRRFLQGLGIGVVRANVSSK